jgi:predicted RecA/RadA family phage recombinase
VNTLVSQGRSIEITAAAPIASGQPVQVGALVGISANSYITGDLAVIWLEGMHQVNKAAEAWTAGAKVYWDNVNSVFTVTAGALQIAGYTGAAQLAGDAQGLVILRQ